MDFNLWYQITMAEWAAQENHTQRLGQFMVNSLPQQMTNLLLMHPSLDPFFNDDNISKFLTFLAEHWIVNP